MPTESPESFSRFDRVTQTISYPAGDDQGIARVLVEELVWLDMQCIGESIPYHLIDADDLSAAVATAERATKADEKDRVAGDGLNIDNAVKWNRQLRLKIEAIESVYDVQVLAVWGTHRTVWLWQVDPESSVVTRIRNSESVAGERIAWWTIQIKEGVNARGPTDRWLDKKHG
jgi:hypothetical protein